MELDQLLKEVLDNQEKINSLYRKLGLNQKRFFIDDFDTDKSLKLNDVQIIDISDKSSKDFSSSQGKDIAVYYAGVNDSKGELIRKQDNNSFYSNILSSCK